MKASSNFQSSAINRAARGLLDDNKSRNRPGSMYGFKNRALHMSEGELKEAWKKASAALRKPRG